MCPVYSIKRVQYAKLLGRILISDLVVANLFAFTFRYASTLLGHTIFTLNVFLHEILYTGKDRRLAI